MIAMTTSLLEHNNVISADASTQGKAHGNRLQLEESSCSQQCQSNEQMAILPSELQNHILSCTGTQAAVLAAGPAGMKAWSANNVAEWLIQHHAVTNCEAENSTAALNQAMKHKLDAAATILFLRTRRSTTTDSGIMVAAAQHGCVCIINKVLKLWADNSIDVGQVHTACTSSMEAACQAAHLSVVRALLDESHTCACHPDHNNSKYLMIAAEYGRSDIVRELLDPVHEQCARANALNSHALSLAAKQGHEDVMLELLDTSRQFHAVATDNECAAARWAASNGHLGCFRALLDRSRASFVAPNTGDNILLVLVAREGHLHIVQELLDTSRPHHATADARDSAALWHAAKNGHADVLRELLWREYRPANPLSVAGDAALNHAIITGNLECCRLLLGYPGLPPRDLPKFIRQAVSDNNDVIALIKETDRRYQSTAGSRSFFSKQNILVVLIHTATIMGLHFWMDYSLNAPIIPQLWKVLFWILISFVVAGYQIKCSTARITAAEQAAAMQNLEYRAAWYKAQQEYETR